MLALAVVIAAVCGAPTGASEIVVRATTVYTMQGDPLSPGAVLVVDGKVAKVGPSLEVPEGADVIDLGDDVVMPGLVDAYTHVGLSGGDAEMTEEITPGLQVLPSIDWRDRAFHHALAEGTTTACVAPGTDNVIAGIAATVKTAGETGKDRTISPQAALLLTVASDPRRRNRSRTRPDSIYVRQPTNRMGVVWLLRRTFHRAAQKNDGHLDRAAAGLRRELEGRVPLVAVSRTEIDLLTVLRLQEELGFQAVLYGADESYKVAEQLGNVRARVILGPLTTASGRGAERTEIAWNKAGLLHEAGVTVALSGGRLLEQAQFAHRFGLPRETALRAITRTPAELLGIGERVGSLAKGRDADLVALSGDPLELSTAVRWVMVDGKIRYTLEE